MFPLSVGVDPGGTLYGPLILGPNGSALPAAVYPGASPTRSPGAPAFPSTTEAAADPMIVYVQFPRRLKEMATRGLSLFVGSTPCAIHGGKTRHSPCAGSTLI